MNDFLTNTLPPVIIVGGLVLGAIAESVAPLRPRTRSRTRHAAVNAAIGIPMLIAAAASGAALAAAGKAVDGHHVGVLRWAGAPAWLAIVVGFLAYDFASYTYHRASHHVPVLWRLHRVHHTDDDVDVTTALRNHPLEFVPMTAFVVAAVLIVGINELTIELATPFVLATQVFSHIRTPLPRFVERALEWITATPAIHRTHHSPRVEETNSNYAGILIAWDRLLGTYKPAAPDRPTGLDIDNLAAHQTLRAVLLEPAYS